VANRPGFRWNRQGYYAFMRANAPAIAAVMEEKARDIAEAAERSLDEVTAPGEEFIVDVNLSSGRRKVPRVAIIAATANAVAAEQTQRTLTRAVEANRD
jgi:RES domain-containing protein